MGTSLESRSIPMSSLTVMTSSQPEHWPPSPTFLTPRVTVAASSFAQEALLAGRALVDRLGGQSVLPSQPGSEFSDRRSVAEPVGSLAAFWGAVDAAAVDRKGVGTHRTDSEGRLAIVTRIVTHGDCAHAPTARASAGAPSSSRTN